MSYIPPFLTPPAVERSPHAGRWRALMAVHARAMRDVAVAYLEGGEQAAACLDRRLGPEVAEALSGQADILEQLELTPAARGHALRSARELRATAAKMLRSLGGAP